MTPEEFMNRCKTICHVGPAGVWEQISKDGFRTAEQLILDADLTDDERQRLLSQPRREEVRLRVHDQDVTLRDQGPLFARKDLKSVLDGGLDVSDWIHLLNQRVYFFTDQASMQKLLDKYVQLDGAQDVVWLSPLKLLETDGLQLELASQNTGAIARRSGPQKTADTFVPLFRFPDRRPAEVTALGGFDDLTAVFRAERCFPDGNRTLLT
ncbi:MAG TPA: hypothetical protein VMP41_13125 [Acidimicrobiales bacterium]|nr:hypothetical protein [Acidimicrobiales bacterium]